MPAAERPAADRAPDACCNAPEGRHVLSSIAVDTNDAIRAEEQLGTRLVEFPGEWVAVVDHRLIDAAPSLAELHERVGPHATIFRVASDPTALQ